MQKKYVSPESCSDRAKSGTEDKKPGKKKKKSKSNRAKNRKRLK